MEICQLLCNSS